MNYSAFYLQDQWTLKRFTLSGALRYDHATSHYLETCIGPDPYVPVQNGGEYAGQNRYCTPATDGVNYNDVTPRWGVAWDVFGTGKTSVKWNMGKYLAGAGISGIYADANPARRTVNELHAYLDRHRRRSRRRLRPDELHAQNGECGDFCGGPARSVSDTRRAMAGTRSASTPPAHRSVCRPRSADAAEQGIPAAVQAYCNAYGDTLLDGWGKRRSEWQFGLGIQHEILPRLSGEVTYNRRTYCEPDGDRSARHRLRPVQRRAGPCRTCQDGILNYTSATYDFYIGRGADRSALPNGGGYTDPRTGQPECERYLSRPAVRGDDHEELDYTWNGVDTNFVWRGPVGLAAFASTAARAPVVRSVTSAIPRSTLRTSRRTTA